MFFYIKIVKFYENFEPLDRNSDKIEILLKII